MVKYNPEGIEGIVSITPDKLYAKSQESLSKLLNHLDRVGYDVRDVSSEKVLGDKPPREIQEKKGWYLWYGRLKEGILQRKAECFSCKSLINTAGVMSHEHKCEVCGNYTYLKYVDGGQIRFMIVDDTKREFDQLTLLIHSYNKAKKQLNLYANPGDCKKEIRELSPSFSVSMEESYNMLEEIMKKFPKTFKKRQINDAEIVSVPCRSDGKTRKHGINTWEIGGKIINCSIVEIFRGKKYDSLDRLPISESVHIHEAWHWAPLKLGPEIYKRIIDSAGLISRKDYYYQDGRPSFNEEQLNNVLKFIDHFTTIDAEKARFYLHPRISGPGLIDTIAKLSGHDSPIETAPNIGHALTFLPKISHLLKGGYVRLTKEEVNAALKAIQHDFEHDNILKQIFRRKRNLNKPKTKN